MGKHSQNFDWVRQNYGLNVGKGMRVRIGKDGGRLAGKEGVVTGADNGIWVLVDGEKYDFHWHPKDIEVV